MQAERFERVIAKQRRYSRDICCAWGTSLNSQAARDRPLLPREQRNRSVAHILRLCAVGLTELWLGLSRADGSTDALTQDIKREAEGLDVARPSDVLAG